MKKKIEYIHAYILINGIISVEKMLSILNDEHSLDITKKELKEIINEMDDISIEKNYIKINGIDEEIIDNIMLKKTIYKNYKIIENIEEVIEEDDTNFSKLSEISKKNHLNDEIRDTILTIMNLGAFSKEFLNAILINFNIKMNNDKKKNLLKDLNSVYENVRIWTLNGHKKSEIAVISKKQKLVEMINAFVEVEKNINIVVESKI